MAFHIPNSLYELLDNFWLEVCFAIFVHIGWVATNKWFTPKAWQGKAHKKRATAKSFNDPICDAFNSGDKAAVVSVWRTAKDRCPTEPETLRRVVWALANESPDTAVEEVVQHLQTFPTLRNARSTIAIFEAISQSGKAGLIKDMQTALVNDLGMYLTHPVYEFMLEGYAYARDEAGVSDVLLEMQRNGQKASARAHAMIIKGYLSKGMLDSAIGQTRMMRKDDFWVPHFAVVQLIKLACHEGRICEVLAALKEMQVTISADAYDVILDDCARRADVDLADQTEISARAASNDGKLSLAAYGSLLKVRVSSGDARAFDLFTEVHEQGLFFSESLYVGCIVRCAVPRFLRFAEMSAKFMRDDKGLSANCFSALMKVYTHCHLHERVLELYDEMLELGLEPEPVGYSFLMRSAVELGRSDLLDTLFERSPNPDGQAYLMLIRSAGRDKDVNRAFTVLSRMKEAGLEVGSAAYNRVLDACVCAGDFDRARSVMSEMRSLSLIDNVSYNTLLKGLASETDDFKACQDVFEQMKRDGLKPDEVSFNCLINAAINVGHLNRAWGLIDAMEEAGVKIDRFTISILLKALKGKCSAKDVQRGLGLLDRVGMEVCCRDGVLLTVALETCIRHKEFTRLRTLVDAVEQPMQFGIYVYGTLIKANSALSRIDRCQELWRQMTNDRGLEPSDIVLGCMIDALVCNDMVTEAGDLLRKWRSKVEPNVVLYAIMIKGFTVSGRADEAMDMWRELKADGVTLNTVIYNSLIDSQARVGELERAHQLVAAMEQDGIRADSITFSPIVKGYCKAGELAKAFDLFAKVHKLGLASDSVVYNILLDSCITHNRMDLADKILKELEKNNVKGSNFTLGILMKLYGRRGQLSTAFKVMEEFPVKHGLVPNQQAKASLMCVCISNNAHDQALEVFEDIKRSCGNQFVEQKTCDVLLNGLLRSGRLAKAVDLVKQSYGLCSTKPLLAHGKHFSAQNLERLMKQLREKDMKEAINLVALLRCHGIRPNGGELGWVNR